MCVELYTRRLLMLIGLLVLALSIVRQDSCNMCEMVYHRWCCGTVSSACVGIHPLAILVGHTLSCMVSKLCHVAYGCVRMWRMCE